MTEEEISQMVRNNFDDQVVSALRKRGLGKTDLADELNVTRTEINSATRDYSVAERFVKLRAKIRHFLDIPMLEYKLIEVDEKEKIGA
ncbi:hypothetical protein [Weissella viridescens]|uniref:hypothetical protein n=1 Tax=Weissella viridescens TaxID=1629 RepID=UPI0022E5480C|nr:hypothetical protein [Weissella viridescens]